MFIDEAKIYLKSGDGGNGCIGFRREKFIEFGGPDGGNGGKGGNIVFIASNNLNSLLDFRYKQHYKASKGGNGSGGNRTGRSADDINIYVPLGTQIFSEDNQILLQDMDKEGKKFIYLEGGKGGLGNNHFKSSINRAPERATNGFPGEEKWVWLKLKLISDIGIVGLPNAGKSSFISSITGARPKIADYPFTTLSPHLGVAAINEQSLVFADIPGLIENAHLGAGLGIKFLKHIERCSTILHMIDINSPDIVGDYRKIRHELENYSDVLGKKKELIILSKLDYLNEENLQILRNVQNELGKEVLYFSSITKLNLSSVLNKCFELVKS